MCDYLSVIITDIINILPVYRVQIVPHSFSAARLQSKVNAEIDASAGGCNTSRVTKPTRLVKTNWPPAKLITDQRFRQIEMMKLRVLAKYYLNSFWTLTAEIM